MKGRILRPRVLIYAGILAILLVALVVVAGARGSAELTVLRGIGAPFQVSDGLAQNQIRIKIQNRSDETHRYQIALLGAEDARLVAPENPLEVTARAQRSTSVFVMISPSRLVNGQRPVLFRITDEAGFEVEAPYRLLGPEAGQP